MGFGIKHEKLQEFIIDNLIQLLLSHHKKI